MPSDKASSAKNPAPREKIIDALMALAAQKPFGEISLVEIAERAGVTLADLRDAFPSKGAILGAFMRRIDHETLDGLCVGDTPKDRLFDVLMRRFDALAPYRNALQSIYAAVLRDPPALAALNQLALNAHRYMLAAAGIQAEGPVGALKLQGLALAYAHVFKIWLDDESEDLAKTMAALDRELLRGEMLVQRAEEAERRVAPLLAPLFNLAERFLPQR